MKFVVKEGIFLKALFRSFNDPALCCLIMWCENSAVQFYFAKSALIYNKIFAVCAKFRVSSTIITRKLHYSSRARVCVFFRTCVCYFRKNFWLRCCIRVTNYILSRTAAFALGIYRKRQLYKAMNFIERNFEETCFQNVFKFLLESQNQNTWLDII